jgi:hypothetical protein
VTDGGHRSDRCSSQVLGDLAHRSDWSELSCCSCSVLFKWFACIGSGGVALVQGELACVQGELFVVFELFRVCLLQVILLFAFVWLSIACWSFLLFVYFLFLFTRVTICGCCQCTHQGEIEDHVWFEDQWMVTSWCDE